MQGRIAWLFRMAHNHEIVGSNPTPAIKNNRMIEMGSKKLKIGTAELNRIIKASSEAGHNEGSFEEAQESLKKRFTDRELDVIITMCWQSPMMQEIRNRLYTLEQAVMTRNKNKT